MFLNQHGLLIPSFVLVAMTKKLPGLPRQFGKSVLLKDMGKLVAETDPKKLPELPRQFGRSVLLWDLGKWVAETDPKNLPGLPRQFWRSVPMVDFGNLVVNRDGTQGDSWRLVTAFGLPVA